MPLHLSEGCPGEARPVHRRIGQWPPGIEQPAVFDKQQTHGYQRRHILEGIAVLMRITVVAERLTAAVVNAQPGLEFLCVGHEEAVADVTLQCRREMHLLLYGKAAARQALEKIRELRIAQQAIERPGLGEVDAGTDAGLELIVEI